MCLMGVDITEVFSPVRANELAAKFGLAAGSSLDLRKGWDSADKRQQEEVWELIERE